MSRHLAAAAREATGDVDDVRRLDILRQIFAGDLPAQVENALRDVRDLGLEGRMLRNRIEVLRERYRLNPPDDSDRRAAVEPEVIRIVCSDGLVN